MRQEPAPNSIKLAINRVGFSTVSCNWAMKVIPDVLFAFINRSLERFGGKDLTSSYFIKPSLETSSDESLNGKIESGEFISPPISDANLKVWFVLYFS